MVKTEIQIRQAVPGDGPELLALIRIAMAVYARNSGIPTLLESQLETLDDLMEHIATDHVLVAQHHGQLVGTVRLVRVEKGTAYFSRFAVLPGMHRFGLGKMIFEAAEDWFIKNAVRTVILYTALDNAPLVSFYEAKGFRLVEESTGRGYRRGTFQKNYG